MALGALLAFVTVFLLTYVLSRSLTETRFRVAQRVEMLDPTPKKQEKRKRAVSFRTRGLRIRYMDKLDGALARGEIELSAKNFLIRWALITLCGGVIAFLASGLIAFLTLFAVSYLGTLLYIRARAARRLSRFEEGLHDMLTITANSLRAGYSFIQAVQVVSEDMHGPIQHELTRILAEMNVGVPLEEAFKSGVERMQSEDFNLIVTAILIQRQVGGNLAEVLDQIAETIRERVRLKREVQVLTSQGRMSGLIFMLLPIGVGLMIYIISPTYISVLFQSAIGLVMLSLAFFAQVIGFFIIRKIVNIET